jgi:photosystem II stability/assembly factor-like uncharacterized protein
MKRLLSALAVVALASPARADWVPTGPDGGRLQALAIDPSGPATLYALALEDVASPRLYGTTDRGASWSCITRLPDSCLTSMAVDPHDRDIVYACGRDSRICRSTDGGSTWSRVSLSGYAAMVIPDPLVPGRVFVAGYCRSGAMRPVLFVSTDFGVSWEAKRADTLEGHAMCCDLDLHHPGTVYFAGTNGRLYRTTDAGGAWEARNSGLPPTSTVQTVSVNHANPAMLLAATTAGLYRTTDAGMSWSLVQAETRSWKAEFSPADPALAYAIGYDFFAQLHVSTDSGLTWTTPSPGTYVNRTDGLHADPARAEAAWLYTNGGVKRTEDCGAHWSWTNRGMAVARVSAMSAATWDPARVYLATSDNGVFRSSSGGDSWDRCAEFAGCGNIRSISIAPEGNAGILYALEGSG